MSIKAHIEKDYVLIELGFNVDINELKEYQYKNIEYIKYSNRIYDMSLFDFSEVNIDAIDQYIMDMEYIDSKTIAKKVAIVTPTDEGQIAARLYTHKASKVFDFIFGVFQDLESAIDWVLTNEDFS